MLVSALALLAQTVSVGTPTADNVRVDVREVKRVGQKITVDYTLTNEGEKPAPIYSARPTLVKSKAGQFLEVASPADEPVEIEQILPGASVGQVVTFEIDGSALENAVYGTSAPTLNDTSWFFVVGGSRIPFKF